MVLRGSFGGKLQPSCEGADTDVVDMLLEMPTGLHFTEVQIDVTFERLLSTVRLAEACSETLTKLSYNVFVYDKSHLFSWYRHKKLFFS